MRRTAGFCLLAASVACVRVSLTAQTVPGIVTFANKSSAKVINGQTGNSVTANDHVRAALYWAPAGSGTFVQIGAAIDVGTPLPGLFAGGTRTAGAATPGGTSAQFQVKAWGGSFATYELAQQISGVLLGQSAIVQGPTGNPSGAAPTPPPFLVALGLKSFTLTPNSGSILPPTLTCATNKTVSCGSAWAFDAPTALDGCTTNSLAVSLLGTVTNGLCPQLITRTWAATNSCDTNYVTCSQVVTVADTTPPVLTGITNKTVQCGAVWGFDSPTATDACSGANVTLWVAGTITNGVCPQVITRTWFATDLCGNTNTCSQVVTVADTTPPVLTGATNKTVQCGTVWAFDPPTATDACSGTNVTLWVAGTITNGVCPQVITRTWFATDLCGNTNTCSQVVTVADTTPPVLTGATNKTVQCGSAWAFDPPTATDACSGSEVTVWIAGTITNGGYPRVIIRSWSATDACGNSNSCSQAVTLLDESAPVLICGTNKTVSCESNWAFDVPSAYDSCAGTELPVGVISTVSTNLDACTQYFVRTWAVTNLSNTNMATCSQAVTVTCTNCPIIAVTKQCPPHPVPPGGTLAYAGTVTNMGNVPLTNVVVVSDQPAPNTVVYGPATLAAGAGAQFTGSYRVPPCSCGPFADTLSATGQSLYGGMATNSYTSTCPGTATYGLAGDLNGDGIVDQDELNAVLASYWATSPWVYMTNATSLGGGYFQFALTNATGWNFSVLASTNLADWTNLPGPAYPVYQFYDPEAATNAPMRAYRLRWP